MATDFFKRPTQSMGSPMRLYVLVREIKNICREFHVKHKHNIIPLQFDLRNKSLLNCNNGTLYKCVRRWLMAAVLITVCLVCFDAVNIINSRHTS